MGIGHDNCNCNCSKTLFYFGTPSCTISGSNMKGKILVTTCTKVIRKLSRLLQGITMGSSIELMIAGASALKDVVLETNSQFVALAHAL